MTDVHDVLRLAQKVADQAEAIVSDLGTRLELTPIIIPKSFDQRDLAEICETHGFSEIKYNAQSRQFFGVRLIEDQEETI